MRGIDITITHGGFGAAYDVNVNVRYFGRCRDFLSTWIPKLIGLSGLTWPYEPRLFEELGISFDGF